MKVQAIYQGLAPGYDWLRPVWTGGLLGGAERFLQMEVLPRYCPVGGAVLDLGCGTGANLAKIVKTGVSIRRYVGVDISPEMLGRAQRRFSAEARAEFCLSDLQRLPFGDAAFDFAICTWTLEHLHGVEFALEEARRVLKQGACLVLLCHSLPFLPWSALVNLVEPVLQHWFQTRFLRPGDWDSSQVCWRFAKGLHTLCLFAVGSQA